MLRLFELAGRAGRRPGVGGWGCAGVTGVLFVDGLVLELALGRWGIQLLAGRARGQWCVSAAERAGAGWVVGGAGLETWVGRVR